MFTVLSVHAQRVVTGKVIEQDTQDAVIQATASILSGEKVVANGVTNTDGAFRVTAPSDGTYTLKITYVGFKTYTKKFTLKDGKGYNAGTISLSPDAIMLKGATVTARASKVTLKADTFCLPISSTALRLTISRATWPVYQVSRMAKRRLCSTLVSSRV